MKGILFLNRETGLLIEKKMSFSRVVLSRRTIFCIFYEYSSLVVEIIEE